ncbi:MAG: TetR/AcrR family transcriptional regulator [Solirubrobacterales bacterium]|nr:TetR/AcrR family transcriptional regulator [Solirubrobacterales bacterium]MBV9717538.1 TetR/AcrR family transcriptional regulator [Solirubrobacterales bacterium]
MESTDIRERRRPGARKDPEADRLILETAHRLLRELGYDRLTMDAVAREAGVARTTVYRRYKDKADLVSAAIDTLRMPARRSSSGDVRRDLVAQLDSVRRNYGVSLAGTLLMEEPYNPRLLELFRERMVTPQRGIVAETIRHGIERGEIRPDVDVERILDLLLGAFFAAVFAGGRPGPDWPEAIIDALWPALAARQARRL